MRVCAIRLDFNHKINSIKNKYNLNDCVVIEEDGYKIVGYGDLETMFIDDRNINIENNYESEMGI